MIKEIPKPDLSEDDPLVLVYRSGGMKSTRGICYVRQSELSLGHNLFPIQKSVIASDFDAASALRRIDPVYPIRPQIELKIRNQLMPAEIRKQINAQNITLSSLAKLKNEITSVDDQASQYFLTLVTDQLKLEGLWRDEDKDLTMIEAFPLDQTKVDARLKSSDIRALKYGTHLDEATLTHEDLSAPMPISEGLGANGFLQGPELSEPALNNLMRASPRDLYQQIARRMIDTHYFSENQDQLKLYPCCYFTSRGVQEEFHFNILMKAGLDKKFDHYSFEQYSIERTQLRRLLREFMEEFFLGFPGVVRYLSKANDSEKRDPRKVWARFYQVWENLTLKQQEALELVYMNQDALSYSAAARALGISLDSFKSRIRTAIQKFKTEFPELEGISEKKLPRTKLKGATTHNGLWRYETAAMRAPLTRIDPKNGLRFRDAEFKAMPRQKNLDWKTVAHIKAKIIESCPMPNIHGIEYFDGTKPTIMSGGVPENRKRKNSDE